MTKARERRAPVPRRETAAAARPSRRVLVAAACVGLAVALVWAPSLSGGFCSDDRFLIVENDLIRQPGAVFRMFTQELWHLQVGAWRADYYRPLTNISLVLDDRWHGEHPAGFHATNLALHGLTAGLLALWLAGMGVGFVPAAAGAFLFGVHPVHDGSVAWIAGRSDPLAALWVLAYLVLDRHRGDPRGRALALAALALGLLSKETAVIAPPLAVGAAVVGGDRAWRALRDRWDAGLVVVGWFALRAAVLGVAVTGGQVAMPGIDGATRLVALPHLLGLIAVPWLGRVEYAWGLRAADLLPAAAAGLVLAVALVVASRTARRRAGLETAGAADPAGLLLFGAAVSFAPAAAATLLKATIAQRLLYMPALFLIPAVALLVLRLAPPRGAWAALVILALLWSGSSLARIPRWSSSRALWEAAVRDPHASVIARSNLADALHEEGLLVEALDQLDRALPDDPSDVGYRLRAVLYTEIGCHDLAIADYREALARNPGNERTANNLASTLGELGRYDEADAVLARFSSQHGAPAFMARNRRRLQQEQDAAAHRIPPAAPDKELTCGEPAAARARLHDARFLTQRALRRLRGGVLSQAFVLAEAATRADPTYVPAQLALAGWHVRAGAPDAARALLRAILAREPANEAAQRMMDRLNGARSPAAEPGAR